MKKIALLCITVKMLIPCLLIAVLIMFLSIPLAYADGIFNNGLCGISIDIYSTPYSTIYAARGQSVGTDVVYGYYGCGWFASARVYQLTGKDVPLSNGVGWWKNAENLGFSKGYTAPTSGNALICYKKKINSDGTEYAHVEVIEGFSGDKVIISMGGDPVHPDNGYCSIGLYDKSHLSNSDIEGFVYLQRPEGEMLTSGFNRVIPDGDYVIVNTGNSDSDRSKFYYLDIEGGETTAANGANVYLQGPISSVPPACDIWSVTYNSSDKFYTIKQKGTNMCLEIESEYAFYGAKARVHYSTNSSAQKWAIELNGKNGYRLRAKCSGNGSNAMCLTTSGLTNNAQIIQSMVNNSNAQSWLFIPYQPAQPIENDRYILLYSSNPVYELDLPGNTGDLENSTSVMLWNDKTPSQFNSYDVIPLSNGYYKIKHVASGKCLDVTYGLADYNSNISNVAVYEDNGSITQQWAIIENGTSFKIISRCNGYCLDIDAENPSDGTNVDVYPFMYNSHQGWTFALAERKICFIADDADGGIPDEQIKFYKSAAVIPDLVPTRDNSSFVCWTDPSDLTDGNQPKRYYPGDVITEDRDFELYALWEASNAVASDSCGNNITWVLDNTGKLTISGTGEIVGDQNRRYGWEQYRDQIHSIEIENGITSIGQSAFRNEVNLTSVIIPSSITTIGNMAFDACSSLPSIVLPDTVTNIGYCAFRNCRALTSINLPRELISVGEFAFMFCSDVVVSIPTGLPTKQHIRVYDGSMCCLHLPATITEMGDGAFMCTNIPVKMDVAPDFILPESLHTIESEAFSGISASYVFIPENKDGKTTIGDRAFANCKQLQYIWIGDCSEIEIADNAFTGCNPNLIIIDDAESVLDAIYSYAVDHGIEWIGNEYYIGDG